MKLAVIFSCDARSASSLAPSVSGADDSGEAGDAGDAGGAGDAGDPAARRFPRVGVTAAAVEGVDSALWGPLDLSRQSLTWRARAAGLNERPQCWQLTSSALARALYSPGCPFTILICHNCGTVSISISISFFAPSSPRSYLVLTTGQIYSFYSSVLGGPSAAPFTRFFYLWCAAQRRVLRAFYVLACLLGSWGICQLIKCPGTFRLITFDYVFRKGAQSNW